MALRGSPCLAVTALDLRASPRYLCLEPPPIRLAVRPSFASRTLEVLNISCGGLGLLGSYALPLNTRLVLRWHYGPARNWRNLLATVVHTTHRLQGDWVTGCQLDVPLQGSALREFLDTVEHMRSF